MKTLLRLLGFAGDGERWSVDILEQGRSGTVQYREPSGTIAWSWEFGGNEVIASIFVGKDADWSARHPWALGRRAEILQRVGDEVIRQRAPGCRAEIDEVHGLLNFLNR